jgi:hypothetical protein
MSDTCSSGFLARIANIVSGYDNFNIRISWKEQIISNFVGRMNAYIRNIDTNNIFRTKYINNIIRIFLQDPKHIYIRDKIIKKIGSIDRREIILEYLKTNPENKKDECMRYFKEHVLYEITLPSSEYTSRPNFSFFYRITVPILRNELYNEFKTHINDNDFDDAFKMAILTYESDTV